MKTKSFSSVFTKCVFVLTVILLLFLGMTTKADAEAIDYLNSNYNGTVTRDTGADMYTEPGTVNPPVKNADGETVHLDYGTELFITSEEFDQEADMWYKCSVVVDGVTYEGYVFNKRVTRGDAVPFTPTPIPSPTPTPTPAPATDGDADPDDLGGDGSSVNEDTQDMLNDSKGGKPWKWVIILAAVIIIFMGGYTLWVRESERKLEREIERYSNRPQYEPLEGELEEDFIEARANYYDRIGLGAQANKGLDEIMPDTSDVQLNMTGVFEDENLVKEEKEIQENSTSYEDDTSLQELIASLEKRLGSSDSYGDDENDKPEIEEVLSEEIATEDTDTDEDMVEEITEEVEPEPEMVKETKIPEFVKNANNASASRRPITTSKPETKQSFAVDRGLASLFEEDEEEFDSEMDIRDILDDLNAGDVLLHRSYGKGIVEDNSDSQIIQVRFGEDVRFLKKDKLVKKNLVRV